MNDKAKSTGRRQMILLVIIFFTPLAIAWLMYFDVITWRPTASSAHGELIQPPIPLPAHQPDYAVRVYDNDFLRGRWTLVYITSETCTTECDKALLILRQVRMSLGKDVERVGRAAFIPPDSALVARLTDVFPGMELVTHDALADEILGQTASAAGEWIYLVDPLGNLMMRFPRDQEPRPLFNDLKRLLKVSRIG